MSLGEMVLKQAAVEDVVAKSLAELRAEVAAAKVPSQDSAAKLVAVEQRITAFERHIIPVLSLMRSQLAALEATVDRLDTKSRLDCLLFKGLQETSDQAPKDLVEDVLRSKFGLNDSSVLSSCHRLGQKTDGSNRAILVRFSGYAARNLVWRQRSKLKGCGVSLSEYLTKTRQEAFSMARKSYGMRCCWTSDGNIFIKVPDGSRHKVWNVSEVRDLMNRYPVLPASVPQVSEPRSDPGTSSSRPKRSKAK